MVELLEYACFVDADIFMVTVRLGLIAKRLPVLVVIGCLPLLRVSSYPPKQVGPDVSDTWEHGALLFCVLKINL